MSTPKVYKGIPLERWIDERLLAKLNDDEMVELHSLMYSRIIDEVEPYVKRSQLIEANLIIDKIKSSL